MAMRTVGDVMRTPVTGLSPRQTLHQVFQLFEQRMISGAPVLEEDGGVLGVLSRTDIAAFLIRGGSTEALVEEIMTPVVFKALADDPITKPLQTMVEMRIHRLVVVDQQNRAVGIVTSLDLMEELLKMLGS